MKKNDSTNAGKEIEGFAFTRVSEGATNPDGTPKSLKIKLSERKNTKPSKPGIERVAQIVRERGMKNMGVALALASMLAVAGIVGVKAKEIIDFVYLKTAEAKDALEAYEKNLAKDKEEKKYRDDKVNTIKELVSLREQGVDIEKEFGISTESLEKVIRYEKKFSDVLHGGGSEDFDSQEVKEFLKSLLIEKLKIATGAKTIEIGIDDDRKPVLIVDGKKYFPSTLSKNSLPGNDFSFKIGKMIEIACSSDEQSEGKNNLLRDIEMMGYLDDFATTQITTRQSRYPNSDRTDGTSYKVNSKRLKYSEFIKGGKDYKGEDDSEILP